MYKFDRNGKYVYESTTYDKYTHRPVKKLYDSASTNLDDIIKRDEAEYQKVLQNTESAMLYLVKNIEKIKYVQYDKLLKHRHSNIESDLIKNFGPVDMNKIDHFLFKHGIYKESVIKKWIIIIHWILLITIYVGLCMYNGIDFILLCLSFIPIVMMGFFTNILAFTLLDTRLLTYRLNPTYAAIRIYKDR